MKDRFAGLTPFLREFAEHMGSVAGALKLVEKFGGQRVAVPRKARPGQVIARACGLEVARALSELRGGESVEVPLAGSGRLKKHNIHKLLTRDRIAGRQGSANEIARAVGCTHRYVKKIKSSQHLPLPLFQRGD